ncbi:hypothetical protein [Microvirga massiliensis]|uniref:hypothetical protein n=1 Tax=Microvirga massiliensis TaxID=1033741 RepID=UPI00062B66D5|nr:hypothetical protein [Microvirga massiliensis]
MKWRPGGFRPNTNDHRADARASSSRHQNEQHRRKNDDIHHLFDKGDAAVRAWTASPADYSGFRVEDHHTAEDTVEILLEALMTAKGERDRVISILTLLVEERSRIRSWAASQRSIQKQPNLLYRRVGLDEDCPDFVLGAVRTAYRKKLHPDGHPPHQRAEAERRFKDAEAVFDEISRLRGL